MRQANAERSVRWTTPKGAVAELRYADNHLVAVVGATIVSSPTIETHQTAGLCLHSGNCWIPISPGAAAEIESIVNEYCQAKIEHDALMAAHYAAKSRGLCPRCHTYCSGDCRS